MESHSLKLLWYTKYHRSVRAPDSHLVTWCRMLLPDAFKGRRGEDSRIWSYMTIFLVHWNYCLYCGGVWRGDEQRPLLQGGGRWSQRSGCGSGRSRRATARHCRRKLLTAGQPFFSGMVKKAILQRWWFVHTCVYICIWRLCDPLHCKDKIPKFIFRNKHSQKRNIGGLSPNFHIHGSVSDLYIPTISLPLLLEEIYRPILGIYKSLIDTWMLK
jgi:hypothetical protein